MKWQVVLPKVNPLIHFGLCNGTRSSPTVRFFTPQGIEAELRCATREFFQLNGGGLGKEDSLPYTDYQVVSNGVPTYVCAFYFH
jgi:hypothetical protein